MQKGEPRMVLSDLGDLGGLGGYPFERRLRVFVSSMKSAPLSKVFGRFPGLGSRVHLSLLFVLAGTYCRPSPGSPILVPV